MGVGSLLMPYFYGRKIMVKRATKFNLMLDKESRFPCLVKEHGFSYEVEDDLSGPIQMVKVCRDILHMDEMAEEHLYMLSLDGKNRIRGISEVSHGGANVAYIQPCGVLQRALLSGAVSIIIAHNHPSGEINPSEADISLTKRMKQSCDLLGIPLLDHLIIGPTAYFSFRESNINLK
jgi:DNA repair protein RadC